jgi:release factor glutamine methyltransferase
MTVRDALREGAAALAGTETPFLDASLLLASALDTDTSSLLASGPEAVGEGRLGRFREFLASRARGLPVAYILGYKEFWGRRFAVDPRALVPRPETETLVEAALRIGDALARENAAAGTGLGGPETAGMGTALENAPPCVRPLRVHDLCTGSGCVAISLAGDRPQWEVSASDLSDGALEVAASNARALLDPGRPGGPLELRRSDLLSSIEGRFDLLVSNPPYVPASEARELLALGWSEPLGALDGGSDGLETLRRLVPEASRALAPGGALLVEADGAQAGAVAELFRASRFIGIETLRDLGGRPRVTAGRMPWTS